MRKIACIIAGTEMDHRTVLFKNRDRGYDARLKIVRMAYEGTEMLFVVDLDSGYLEGINEHGVGIVNTALQVAEDELEGIQEVTKGKTAGKGPKRSKDGPKIFRALAQKSARNAVLELAKDLEDGPIKGHTFVGQAGGGLYCLECSGDTEPVIKKLETGRINTRTNHGIVYPEAGYTEGDDYVSSVIRRWETQKRFQSIQKPEEMAWVLRNPLHEKNSPFNPVRDTEKMRTTNQVMLDLDNLTLHLYLIPEHSEYLGFVDKTEGKGKLKHKVYKSKPVEMDDE